MPQIPTLFPYTTLFRSPRARSSIPGNLSYEKKEQKQNQRRSEGVKGKHQGEDWPRNSQPEHGGRRAPGTRWRQAPTRSEEHTSELQSLRHLVCRLLLEK